MSSKTRWYVALHRMSAGDDFRVRVREDPRQKDSSPAELIAEFHGTEPLRQLLRILPPDRLAQDVSGEDGRTGFVELEAPPDETEQGRVGKVVQSLTAVKSSAHYAALGPRWEQMAKRFDTWRPQPGTRKVLVAGRCNNPECGRDIVGFVALPEPLPLGYLGESYACEHCGSVVDPTPCGVLRPD